MEMHTQESLPWCVSSQAAFEVLTEAQLRERQQETLQEVTSVTGLTEQDAGRVLRLYKWCVWDYATPSILSCAHEDSSTSANRVACRC